MILRLTILALAACISSSWAQWQQGRVPSSSCGACACTDNKYVPFCATDGRRETTYKNRCQFECAQKCTPGLRIKFEGVCAEPYGNNERGSKNIGGNSGSWGSSSSGRPTPNGPSSGQYNTYSTTRSPYDQTTRRPSYGSNGFPTTRRPYYESNGFPTTRRPSYESNGFPTTRRPYYESSGFPTTRRPSYESGYPTTRLPSSYYPITSTSSRPWWQSNNPQSSQSSRGYVSNNQDYRQGRQADDDGDMDEEEY